MKKQGVFNCHNSHKLLNSHTCTSSSTARSSSGKSHDQQEHPLIRVLD